MGYKGKKATFLREERMRKAVVFVAVLLASAVLLSAQVTNAKVTEYGIYSAKILKAADKTGAITGSHDVIGDVEFIQNTDRIPAKLDTRFGFRYVIEGSGEKNVILKKKVIHPPITEKNKTTTSHEYDLDYAMGSESITGFRFGAENLMVAGEWIFQLYYQDKLVLERKFTVYKP
jgi:hypothetical protein